MKTRVFPMATVICPECGAEIDLDTDVEVGDSIECPECGAELEVIKKGSKFDVEAVEKGTEAEEGGMEEESEDLE